VSLDALLREAAPEARFEPGDVARRVRRIRSRRRTATALGVLALLAAGALGGVALLGNDPRQITAGPPDEAPALTLTPDDLAGVRWLADETTGPTTSWLEFDADGRWSAATECQLVSGVWEVRAGSLQLEETGFSRSVGCTTRFALGGSGLLVEGDTLRFAGREGAVVDFHRADRIATVATTDDLTATWRSPGGHQEWVFQPGEVRVNGCRLGAWQIRDDELRVQQPAPPCDGLRPDRQAFVEAQAWLGDGSAEPYLVDDQLYLVTSSTTIRLVRPDATVAEDLTRSPWVATAVADGQTILPRLELRGDGSGRSEGSSRSTFTMQGACSVREGTWRLRDTQVVFEDVRQPTTDCTSPPGTGPADEVVDRAATDVSPELVDGVLTFAGEETVTFRRLEDLAAPTEDELAGQWSSPETGSTITFQTSGGFDSNDFNCRIGSWQLHRTTLRVLDRGRNCTPPFTDPALRLLQVGAFVDVRLDAGRLFLTDELNPDATFVLVPDPGAPRANEAETLMLDAITALGAEQCCGEPSHGGDGATLGFVWEGHDIWGYASPHDPTLDFFGDVVLDGAGVLVEGDDGAEVHLTCGRFDVTLREVMALDPVPDETLVDAAGALLGELDCEITPPG